MGRYGVPCLVLLVLSIVVSPVHAREAFQDSVTLEPTDIYIGNYNSYAGANWIYSQLDGKLVGYAPWDPIRRRWSLFSLDGKYQGFMQATIGEDGYSTIGVGNSGYRNVGGQAKDLSPAYFSQFLFYDSINKYKGLFVRSPGGRPASVRRPDGELGGQLRFYRKGDIVSTPPSYQPEVDPLRRLEEGVRTRPLDSSN